MTKEFLNGNHDSFFSILTGKWRSYELQCQRSTSGENWVKFSSLWAFELMNKSPEIQGTES